MISPGKLPTYILFTAIFCSGLWWCVWVGCDISYSCEEQGRAINGSCCSCEANCSVLWEFPLKLLDGKEELDWFRVFEWWLLNFAVVVRTVFWVSTSFLINSSFVQRFFFRREILFSKDFSCWLGGLLLISLFNYSEKESVFLFKKATS